MQCRTSSQRAARALRRDQGGLAPRRGGQLTFCSILSRSQRSGILPLACGRSTLAASDGALLKRRSVLKPNSTRWQPKEPAPIAGVTRSGFSGVPSVGTSSALGTPAVMAPATSAVPVSSRRSTAEAVVSLCRHSIAVCLKSFGRQPSRATNVHVGVGRTVVSPLVTAPIA